jgi:hypothetical protein
MSKEPPDYGRFNRTFVLGFVFGIVLLGVIGYALARWVL